MKKYVLIPCMLMLVLSSCTAQKTKKVVLETTLGNIKLELFDDTPLHKENFLKLVESKHYDGMLFHRVINDFMIQAGDSQSKNATKGQVLGAGGPEHRIDAELTPGHLHVRGALAAARQGDQVNPEKKSSPEQFYIVEGKKYTDEELDAMVQNRLNKAKNDYGMKLFAPLQNEYRQYAQNNDRVKVDSLLNVIQTSIEEHFKDNNTYSLSPETRELYKTEGGTPFLDGDYTVFGRVVEGMDVVDKIAEQKTDSNNRPEEDIRIIKAYTVKK